MIAHDRIRLTGLQYLIKEARLFAGLLLLESLSVWCESRGTPRQSYTTTLIIRFFT